MQPIEPENVANTTARIRADIAKAAGLASAVALAFGLEQAGVDIPVIEAETDAAVVALVPLYYTVKTVAHQLVDYFRRR